LARRLAGLLVYHSILLRGLKILWGRLLWILDQGRGDFLLRFALGFVCEVFMGGRLFSGLGLLLIFGGYGAQRTGSAGASVASAPVAEVRPLEENFHGTKVVDKYRWLEDSSRPETRKWVGEEMAYTRAVLDPLPGRDLIRKRLSELLGIGDIGVPRIGGKYYFYTRRDGLQNQPVLYVRDGVGGKDKEKEKEKEKDRVLVDVNQLAADGTVALDWFWPAEHGKYVAYGTSSSGSEMSTLHIVETRTGKLLPDMIERTRAASIAWSLDNSGFYYTRYPKKGDVAEGQERYNRHVFYHELGTDPGKDDLIFGEGRDAEDWPDVRLDNDGRMLLITVSQGWTKTELFLMDLK
jgi:prolyl oligopeptidase